MRLDQLALGFTGVLCMGVIVAYVEQRQTNARLRHELDALHRRLGVPAAGATHPTGDTAARSNDPMGDAALAKLRADLGTLERQVRELQRRAAPPGGAAPVDFRPANAWKNAGRDTPEAALESFLWAADGGELDVLAATIVLDPAAREKATALLARLPPAVRAQYDTPEKFVALFLARDTDARAMQVLGENKLGEDRLVNLRLLKDDGKTKDEGYQFRRTSDGWRLVVPAKMVDKFGKKLTEPPKK